MIISHKYKFLFIGLPFSASSALTKELHTNYEGKPFLRKHSLYYEFAKVATEEEKKYFVFAVLRNPMEMTVTVYEKMRANAKGNFTNTQLFQKNGGHITDQQLERFKFIQDNNASFQEYFLQFFTKPHDTLASMTVNKCDFVIRYEHIAEDYITALKMAGVVSPLPLPVANKTSGKKKNEMDYYTEEIQQRAVYVFGPFLKKHGYNFPESWKNITIPYTSKILFELLSIVRRINQRLKKKIKRKSISGSIYGDMQREG